MPVRAAREDLDKPGKTSTHHGHVPALSRSRPALLDDGLLSALKDLRTKLAQEAGVPAYIIFSNATLSDMAEKMPRTLTEFLEVSGVGEFKAERYGEQFLNAINTYAKEAKKYV